MESLVACLIIFGIQVILLRWIFRVDRIVTVLEQMAINLESIKQQTTVLIKQQNELIEQQEEIAELLEVERDN